MKVGKNLKLLRKSKKLTLKELSEKSGVAIATLSRIEHDIMIGTLKSHVNICKALEITLSDFYRDVESSSKTVSRIKKNERSISTVRQKEVRLEMLVTKTLDKKMAPMLLHISRCGRTQKEQDKPGVEKVLYLLEGSLIAEIGKQQHKLTKGDSIYFDASLPHIFVNGGRGEACAICVSSPPIT